MRDLPYGGGPAGGGDDSERAAKRFPRGLRRSGDSFNVEFDHNQHNSGAARPERGCASCHAPVRRAVAFSIPVGFSAHNRCYECHSPGRSAAELSSCNTCHTLGASYIRTSTNARAFRVGFSHGDHGLRQRLTCISCHVVKQRGLPQTQQVSVPRAAFHTENVRAQSCMSCHNGQRAFGDENFNDCKRCHTGETFRHGGETLRMASLNESIPRGVAAGMPGSVRPDAVGRAGAADTVTMEVVVDSSGKVTSARAVSGSRMLYREAENAARVARFSPTLLSEVVIEDRSMADIKSEDLTFGSLNIDEVTVRVSGDRAVVTGRATAKGRYKGEDISVQERFTNVLVKWQGRWQAVASMVDR